MEVLTDSPGYAATVLPGTVARRLAPGHPPDAGLLPVLECLASQGRPLHGARWEEAPFHLLVSEYSPRSQYDQLLELARRPSGLPDRIACLAGSGRDFHGFKGRAWAAVPGNIHLSLHLAPNRPVPRFQVAFTALAALSVVEAIGGVEGLSAEPRIKWVNDILMRDAKVAGILAYTQTRDARVSAVVLGIGVNVETTPRVEPTPFVPEVASLRDFLPAGGPDLQSVLLQRLLGALDRNYRLLLAQGAAPLLQRYRELSMLVGREVTVCTDALDEAIRVVDRGRVAGFGENLELILEGRPVPLTSGRIALGSV